MKARGIFVAACLLLSAISCDACTMVLVAHKATVDGSAMALHTDDAGFGASDYRMVRVPARDNPPGSMRAVYSYANGFPRLVANNRGAAYAPKPGADQLTEPLGHIPEVPHTYAYYDQDNAMINEKQLAISESTTTARTCGWSLHDPQGGMCMFSQDALTRVALERCDSARCAVTTMGALAYEHGFFSQDCGPKSNPDLEDGGEALGIVDKFGEAWEFQVMTGPGAKGAIWVAQRVPDNAVHVNANDMTIRKINLTDTDNFLASPGIVEVATAQGWYVPARDGPQLDVWKAFAMHPPGFNGTQNTWDAEYTLRRMWRVYSLVKPSVTFDPNAPGYPFSVVPDKKLSATDAMGLLRDFFEGTPYDLTVGLAAGPFNNPYRYDTYGELGPGVNPEGGWERSISIDRGLFSFIAVARPWLPDAVGAMVWYGPSRFCRTLFQIERAALHSTARRLIPAECSAVS